MRQLPQEFSNDKRLKILENQKIIEKFQILPKAQPKLKCGNSSQKVHKNRC